MEGREKAKKAKQKAKSKKRRRKIILLKRQDPQACGAAFAYGSLILTYRYLSVFIVYYPSMYGYR